MIDYHSLLPYILILKMFTVAELQTNNDYSVTAVTKATGYINQEKIRIHS